LKGFIIFLIVFFSIYTGLHLYGFLKVKRALTPGPIATAVMVVFMVSMIVAPVMIRISERHGFELSARCLAYVGFTWMGLLFLFVSTAFALDIYRFLVHIGKWALQADLSALTLSHRQLFFIALIFAVSATAYGAFEAVGIRLEHVTLNTDKIPKAIGRLRIAQISDVHIGLIVGEKRLKRIIQQINAAKPDILISTGDLVDGQMDDPSGFADMLREIDTKYGKFAVTGNHEFYAGLDRSIDFTEKAGFTVLRGESLTVSDLINIAGVDDEAGKRYGLAKAVSEKKMLSALPNEHFTLFLKHRPVVDNQTPGLFDLQLSGHTHKGQIFPFSLLVSLFYPHRSGLVNLEKNSRLYVSRGTGTWGPPIRFLSAPEVTLIELVCDTEPSAVR
jgi:predicted MPP superfamily phosphohydrolase